MSLHAAFERSGSGAPTRGTTTAGITTAIAVAGRAPAPGAGGSSRILYVSGPPLVPSKLGPARRNHHVISQLSRFYDVSVLSIGDEAHASAFLSSCSGSIADVRFVRARRTSHAKFLQKVWRTASGRCDFLPAAEPALRRAYQEMSAATRFDAVVLSSVLLASLPLRDSVPVVADTHNVEFDVHRRTAFRSDRLLRRAYAAAQWRWTKNEERRLGRRVRLLLATSDRDQQIFKSELQIDHAVVIPNGIDLEEFFPAPASEHPVILFSGLMSYHPNQHGIRWFLDEVFPLVRRHVPAARVIVAGASPPSWLAARRSHNIEVTGRVDDMRPYIASAAVVIAPLLIGGGTRVKILEAQAMRRPVVSTTVGAEGLHQRHGDTLLLGDDAATFAHHLTCLLLDRRAAAHYAYRGHQHVVDHFDWNLIGDRLARILNVRLGLSSRA